LRVRLARAAAVGRRRKLPETLKSNLSANSNAGEDARTEEHSRDSGMLVFREGRRSVAAAALLKRLDSSLAAASSHAIHSGHALLAAFLHAGELECALQDIGSETGRDAAALTDTLAECLVQKKSPPLGLMQKSIQALSSASLPRSLTVSLAEGFAYYALHPLDYVEALIREDEAPPTAMVVGIRSIGTTLSAVVRAHLSSRNIKCDRFTVRPVGQPFDRRVELDARKTQAVARAIAEGATFYVVDEGPGLSGSSFLATAEALLREGVSSSKIILICSNQADFNALLAANAAQRWQRFRTIQAKAGSHLPRDATTFFGGGLWRERCFATKEEWPASWLQMERLKFLSHDQRELFRFDGLGSYGSEVRQRYLKVAEGGYGPSCENAGNGFTCFPMVKGVTGREVTPALVRRAAEYCAFRSRELQADVDSNAVLEEMARINLERELGCAIGDEFCLETVRPVIPDGKMMLHEWLKPEEGAPWLKLDSAAHGDDHFFPGATDIAWDIAGTIIEWQMDASAADEFLNFYERAANDRIRARLRSYRIAYGAFRMGYSKMAAAAMSGQEEQTRLLRDYEFYKERLARMLTLEAVV